MLIYVTGTQLLMWGDVRGGSARWAEATRLAEGVADRGVQAALGIGHCLALGWTGPLADGGGVGDPECHHRRRGCRSGR